MRPELRRVLGWGIVAGLLLVVAPADTQIRSDSADPRYFRWSTRRVTINVKPSDYDPATGEAQITVPRAIIGFVRPRRPWYMTVRADPHFELKRYGISEKPCSDVAIRWTGGTGTYRVLSPRKQVVAGGIDIRGRQEVAFDLLFVTKLADIAGEYSIELYFEYTN